MSASWVPRKHQETAIQFILERFYAGALLDPGLGKTSIYLAVIDILKGRRDIRRALVSAPMRVAQTVWPTEAQKWKEFQHLKVADLTEKTDKQREELLSDKKYDIYVINPESHYKIVNPDMLTGMAGRNVPNKWGFDLFLADESTRYADTSTKRFKMLKPILHHYKYRNIATGTPAPNGYHQFFGQAYVLDEGAALGTYITHFRQRYMHAHPHLQYVYEMNVGAQEQILEKIAHLMIRMKAKDHIDMPDLVHNLITVKLPPAVRKQYGEFERDFLIKVLDETIPAFNKASLGIKCRQICNGFIYSQENPGAGLRIHSAKLDALAQLLEEMQERPLLVFYEFIEDARAIMERFPFAENITGSKNAMDLVNRFNAGQVPLLIGHPRSAGHGLNIQEACSDICWFGFNKDLELWVQAIARLWRSGQKSPVVKNHVLIVEDSVDEGTFAALTVKEETQEAVDQFFINYAKAKLGYN